TVHAADRKREVIGRATLLELMEHREIELRLRPVKAPAQGFATFAHAQHRIDLIRNKVAHLMLDHDPRGPPGVSPPDDGGPEILRMQRPDMEAYTARAEGRRHRAARRIRRSRS